MIDQMIILVGYSGHSYVVIDALKSQNIKIKGYFELHEQAENPYNLKYLGSERDESNEKRLRSENYFVSIGDNFRRHQIINKFGRATLKNALHATAIISPSARLGKGILINTGAIINANSTIEDGVICNTSVIIEHDCHIKTCAHLAPGVRLGGNVEIGPNTLIGIGSIILPGVTIGCNCIIGAGSTITKNIPDNMIAKGRSPIKLIPNKNI